MKKRDYIIAYILFFVFLVAVTIAVLWYLHRDIYSYETYLALSQAYDVLISNIGITAVIAIAGLGLMALYNKRSERLNQFIIVSVCFLELSVVFILGFCHFTGVANMSPYGDQYVYHGPTLEGMAEGKGELFNPVTEELVYSGYFKANQYNGYGVQYESINGHNYVCYLGEFNNGQYCGKGYFFNYDAKYNDGPGWNNMVDQYEETISLSDEEKELVDSVVMNKKDKKHLFLRYSGYFESNTYNGYGVQYDSIDGHNYVCYLGEFNNGQYCGKGYLFGYNANYSDGPGWNNVVDQYEETISLSDEEKELVESVVMNKKDKKHLFLRYSGYFESNTYNGEGIEYGAYTYEKDNEQIYGIYYTGNFVDGRWNGEGTEYQMTGPPEEATTEVLYEGEFEDGRYHGEGILYDSEGYVEFEGRFKKGKGIKYYVL